jgi:hypothetical protein
VKGVLRVGDHGFHFIDTRPLRLGACSRVPVGFDLHMPFEQVL